MTEHSSPPDEPGEPGFADDELERLRQLLLGPEQELLRRISERLDEDAVRARETGKVLPEAVSYSLGLGPGLERALAPSLGRVTREAVRRDAKVFADALFPVMGPAIRKAISEALRGLIQALNQALEHSLSLRGLGWRLEAIRTGRSFGEVVLAKTLVFRVEQVFLIHRDSGLLLQHVVAPEVVIQDADMVSGMLTAIRDFARDSFHVGDDEGLQTMEVGDLQVWVEQGPRAILAAVLRGTAPVELRLALREALEGVHLELGGELGEFQGDAAPFVRSRPLLEDCLRRQVVKASRQRPTRVWVLALLLLALVVGWGAVAWVEARKFGRFLHALGAEPGIVVTGVVREDGARVVTGLKDPLASPPQRLLDEHGLDADRVRFRLGGFHSLEAPLVVARARQALEPPATVDLAFEQGVLSVVGTADAAWIARARSTAPLVAGVERFDSSRLRPAAEGELRALADRVEAHHIRFELASSQLAPSARAELGEVARLLFDLVRVAAGDGLSVRVRVEGQADPSGTAEFNLSLSRSRARAVVDELVVGGVPADVLEPVGRGSVLDAGADHSGTAPQLEALRRVSFDVEIGALGRAAEGTTSGG